MGFVYLHGVRMKAHEGKSWWRGRRDSIWAFGGRGRVFLACFYFWPLLFADFERADEGKFVSFVPLTPFVTCECAKAHEGDSWSLAHRFSAATVVKATEVPSLSFGDALPNDHEGASSRSTESNRRRTTLLRGADHEAHESALCPQSAFTVIR